MRREIERALIAFKCVSKGYAMLPTNEEISSDATTDPLLLAQIASGCIDAFNQFYRKYYEILRRFIWHRLNGDEQEISEALQDIFMVVYTSASMYRGNAQVKTWLFGIAQNIVRARQRRSSRSPTGIQLTADLASSDNSLEEQVITTVSARELLDSLPQHFRIVLELTFTYGFDTDEIAEILSIPKGTVKSRRARGRNFLIKAKAASTVQEEKSL